MTAKKSTKTNSHAQSLFYGVLVAVAVVVAKAPYSLPSPSSLLKARENGRPIPTLLVVNPLRPNNDESQTSHCNNKGVSVSEVVRIENMITQVKFY